MARELRKKSYHLIGPNWEHAKNETVPFYWSDLRNMSPEQKRMTEDSKKHGLNSGVLIPFHGRSGYSLLWVMSSKEENDTRHGLESAKRKAYEVLPFVHDAVKRVIFGNTPILSKREREALYWIAEGLSTKEASENLCISPVTIEKHIPNACKKLEAKNRTQCVRIAIHLGLIIPGEKSFNFSIKNQ